MRLSREASLVLAALLFFTLAVLSACSSGPASPAGSPAAARQYTAEQAPAFADGVITRDEYEAATHATIACMEEAGLKVQNIRWQGERRYTFDWTSDGGGPQIAYEQCFDRYADDIDAAWSMAHEPTQRERDDARLWVQRCLADRGQQASIEDLTPQSVQDYVELSSKFPGFTACSQAAQEEFGFQAV